MTLFLKTLDFLSLGKLPAPSFRLAIPALLICCLVSSPCLSGLIDLPDDYISAPTPLPSSQDDPSKEIQPRRPWQIIIGYGRRNDNARWDNLVQGLASGGYDDGQCAGWFGPCPYPSGEAQHQIIHIALVRDIGSHFGVRIFWNNGDYVEGTGYDDSSYSYLKINSNLESWGLLVEFVPAPAIRLGLGLTWNTLETSAVSEDWDQQETGKFDSSAGLAGFVLGGAINAPANRPAFLHLSLQMHVIPDQEIGPFGTMPVTSIEMSHTTIVLGLGLNL